MPKSEPQPKAKERIAEQNSVPTAASAKLSTAPSSSTPPEKTSALSIDTAMASAPPAPEKSKAQERKPPTTEMKKPDSSSDVPPASKPQTLTLHDHTGDLFAAPPHTVLIHACNTQGSWGAGIAAAFRTKYPIAYTHYRAHCLRAHDPKTNPVPTGTCLLIPPCETKPGAQKHWVACLFTSAKYGRAKDKPAQILKNTGPAVKDLMQQVKDEVYSGDREVSGLRMCKINSAMFAVPWEKTVEVLEGIEVEEGWMGDIEVWDREE